MASIYNTCKGNRTPHRSGKIRSYLLGRRMAYPARGVITMDQVAEAENCLYQENQNKRNIYYFCLAKFGIYSLKQIRMKRLKQVRWIHGELLCMPPRGNFLGGQDYHKMADYFMKL